MTGRSTYRRGKADFVVEDQLELPEDVQVLAVYPHAHYLGKRMEGWAELPGGKREDLILIPSWDIDRQSIYRFRKPVDLPAGSVVHMRFTYDNSAANAHNPNSPPIRVKAGNRLDPASFDALYNLATIEAGSGQVEEARRHLERAEAERPGDVDTHRGLVEIYGQEGRMADAVREQKVVVGLEPTQADGWNDLGVLDVRRGDRVAARSDFERALKLDPENATAKGNLARLAAAGAS